MREIREEKKLTEEAKVIPIISAEHKTYQN